MRIVERLKSERGSTRLGFADVVTALILLGILLYVSYLQMSVYHAPAPAPGVTVGAARPTPP
jgi:multisubunit Na+/H+ antiporter MnhB subunit